MFRHVLFSGMFNHLLLRHVYSVGLFNCVMFRHVVFSGMFNYLLLRLEQRWAALTWKQRQALACFFFGLFTFVVLLIQQWTCRFVVSHTILHTPICHTSSFIHNFVTRSLSQTTFTHTIFHTQLCQTHTHCCIVSLGRDLANGDVLVALMVPGSDDPEFSTYHCRLSNCSRPLTLRGALLRTPKRIKALHVLIIATSTLSALSFYPLDSWNSLRKKLVQQLNNREWESRQVRDSSVPESYPLQSSVASLATDWWMEPWFSGMIEICTNEPMA